MIASRLRAFHRFAAELGDRELDQRLNLEASAVEASLDHLYLLRRYGNELFAAESGKFVCATAGHKLECMLAAHGSGAAALSRQRNACGLHVDVGGLRVANVINGGEAFLDHRIQLQSDIVRGALNYRFY